MGSLDGGLALILLIGAFIAAAVVDELLSSVPWRWRRPRTKLDDAERELFLRTYKYKEDRPNPDR